MTWAFTAVAVISTAASVSQQRKARKAERKAARVAQRRADIERRRAAVQSVEDARQLIGQVQNTAAQTGGLGGSGAEGGVSSIVSQLGANLTFNEQLDSFAKRQAKFMSRAQSYSDRAGTFQAIAGLSMQAAKMDFTKGTKTPVKTTTVNDHVSQAYSIKNTPGIL